jgi:hypothetical protein
VNLTGGLILKSDGVPHLISQLNPHFIHHLTKEDTPHYKHLQQNMQIKLYQINSRNLYFFVHIRLFVVQQ